MKKPHRALIYLGILIVSGYLLAPALSLSFNPADIGAPIKAMIHGWNTWLLAAATVSLALLITYLITSGIGLVLLGALALLGLVATAVLHPFLFPLVIPMMAIWVACALARRKRETDMETENI